MPLTSIQNQWLKDHAGGIPGNVHGWAYKPGFDLLVAKFNKEFHTSCNESHINCTHYVLIDWLIRKLQKNRHKERREGKSGITYFIGDEKKRVPVFCPSEHDAIVRAYVEEGVPRDRLAYTVQIYRICSVVPGTDASEMWHYLQSKGRVGGGLPDICGRGRSKNKGNGRSRGRKNKNATSFQECCTEDNWGW